MSRQQILFFLFTVMISVLASFLINGAFRSAEKRSVASTSVAGSDVTHERVDCANLKQHYCPQLDEQCLAKNIPLLPVQCQSELKGILRDSIVECRDEISKFCSYIQPGEGRLIKCLRSYSGQLSDKCKTRVGTDSPIAPPLPSTPKVK